MGGHCMEYTTKQPTEQREHDQKDESKTQTNDGSRVSVGRISRLLLPGLQSSLLPLLNGNCKSFFWVRVNVQSNHQKKSVLALNTITPCINLTTVCVKHIDTPFSDLQFKRLENQTNARKQESDVS